MNHENFVLQNSLEANYLNVHLQEPLRLDEIAIRVVKEDCPDFLIPFRIVNINDSVSLKYKLVHTIALEYADTTLHKAEFVRLFQNLLAPFIKGKDWFLDYHNFCIDPRYVFLDKEADRAYFIYIPEYSYRNKDEEILRLFQDTFVRMTITDDANFQVRLFQYFSRQDVTLADLYGLIREESGKMGKDVPAAVPLSKPVSLPVRESVSGAKEAQPVRSAAGVSEQVPAASVPEAKPSEDTDEVMKVLFGDNRKKGKEKNRGKEKRKEKGQEKAAEKPEKKKSGGFGLFGRKKEQDAQEKAVWEKQSSGTFPAEAAAPPVGFPGGTVPASSNDCGDKTEIISDEFRMAACLELIDSPIPGALPRIGLDFPSAYITVGRVSSDEIQPDVAFSREFMRIGRRHARIENRDGVYYVIDLGSANHTLLNGQVLVPNQPYQLQDGGELTFTDSKPVRYRIHI